VIELAEMLPPEPSALWTLASQMGLQYAVGGLPFDDPDNGDQQPWDYEPLRRTKQKYNDAGFELAVLESRPPYNLVKRGLPGRDDEIEVICTLIENMGKLGIPVWCYEWMTDFNWLRTNMATPSRGGSVVTSYDHAIMQQQPPSEQGPIDDEALWTNLKYFLEKVIPVAEKANVKLAMHPDDPPLSPIRGVARIMSSIDNYQRLIDLVPSPMNGITLCQGNFTLMTDDLPSVIRHFCGQKKVFFVHFRDVRGTREKFEETWHDAGKTNLLECMRAYRDVGFEGVLRPDHVPTVEGDNNDRPGYSSFGRLYAIGYIRGMRDAVYAEKR
jgi:mannonate dehydratase